MKKVQKKSVKIFLRYISLNKATVSTKLLYLPINSTFICCRPEKNLAPITAPRNPRPIKRQHITGELYAENLK